MITGIFYSKRGKKYSYHLFPDMNTADVFCSKQVRVTGGWKNVSYLVKPTKEFIAFIKEKHNVEIY